MWDDSVSLIHGPVYVDFNDPSVAATEQEKTGNGALVAFFYLAKAPHRRFGVVSAYIHWNPERVCILQRPIGRVLSEE